MKKNISRRTFIKTGMLGAGICLAGPLCSKLCAVPKSTKNVYFRSVKKGRSGCSKCEKAISAMLKDKDMKKQLEELFPDKAKVYFYVRKHKSSIKVKENSIAVGSCAGKTLKDKAKVCVKGCEKQIKPQYVFDSIIEQLQTTDTQ